MVIGTIGPNREDFFRSTMRRPDRCRGSRLKLLGRWSRRRASRGQAAVERSLSIDLSSSASASFFSRAFSPSSSLNRRASLAFMSTARSPLPGPHLRCCSPFRPPYWFLASRVTWLLPGELLPDDAPARLGPGGTLAMSGTVIGLVGCLVVLADDTWSIRRFRLAGWAAVFGQLRDLDQAAGRVFLARECQSE